MTSGDICHKDLTRATGKRELGNDVDKLSGVERTKVGVWILETTAKPRWTEVQGGGGSRDAVESKRINNRLTNTNTQAVSRGMWWIPMCRHRE